MKVDELSTAAESTMIDSLSFRSEAGGPDTDFGPAGASSIQLAKLINKPIPPLLTVSDATAQRRDALFGLGGGLAAVILIGVSAFLLTPPGSSARELVNPANPQSLITVAIFCLFFWALSVVWQRWRRVRLLIKLSDAKISTAAREVLRSSGPAQLGPILEDYRSEHYPLLRRLRALISQWEIEPNLQDASIVLQHHSLRDAEEVQRAYALVRVAVWALPVLGLVGTVLGIAIAVGGFSQFLGGSVTDVEAIRTKLVVVTSGLSFAFLITLEGLLSSLLLMLAMSATQAREEQFYAKIEDEVVNDFLSLLQESVPPRPVPNRLAGSELTELMQPIVAEMIGTLRKGSEQIATSIEERLDAFRNHAALQFQHDAEASHRIGEAQRAALVEAAGHAAQALRAVHEGIAADLRLRVEEAVQVDQRMTSSVAAASQEIERATAAFTSVQSAHLAKLELLLADLSSNVGKIELNGLAPALVQVSESMIGLRPTLETLQRPMVLSLQPAM
jgi:biopolymer transport protein ExbB/TolQ